MQIKEGGGGQSHIKYMESQFPRGGGGEGAINPKWVKRVKGVTTRMHVRST